MRKITTTGLAGLAALAAMLSPGAARAGLEICNDTEVRQTVAIGYKSGETWTSEGWWNIDPGQCARPVRGDLTNRYYYVRAQARGWQFDDDRIPFCTRSDAFTIEGDEDCEARGLDKRDFRKIDTGKTATSYTVNLAAFTRPDPANPQPRGDKAPAPAGAPAAGAGGEPWAGRGHVQGCLTEDGQSYCAFYADGMKFVVLRDGRSDPVALSMLRSFDPGTPIEAAGEIAEFFDASVEFLARRVDLARFTAADAMLHDLQGAWYSVDDAASQFTVLGSEQAWSYDGASGQVDILTISDRCGRWSGAGPYLASLDPEMGETLCYAIDTLTRSDLTLIYLDGGNFLDYRKLD